MGRRRSFWGAVSRPFGLRCRWPGFLFGALVLSQACEQGSECPTTTTSGFFVSLVCEGTISTNDAEVVKVEFRRVESETWIACSSSRPGASGIVCAADGTSDVTAFICAEHGAPAGLVGPRFPGSFMVRAQVGEQSAEEEFRLEAHPDGCTPGFRSVTVRVVDP